ncbi:hypothetical protein AB4189_23015, partial [Vibrio sp. 10N.286.49.E1]|uniref:hypothetical protein n=1 Tax=unclassified Vibrio TaxID=2614977 RepID=UPI00354BE1FF
LTGADQTVLDAQEELCCKALCEVFGFTAVGKQGSDSVVRVCVYPLKSSRAELSNGSIGFSELPACKHTYSRRGGDSKLAKSLVLINYRFYFI